MGRTQINVKVSEQQKQEWEDAVEDHPEVTSLSHLIRLSVTREIRAEQQHSAGTPEDTEPASEVSVSSEVSEPLMRIERQLSSVSDDVEYIRADMTEPDDYFEIVGAINRVLPAKDPDEPVTADDTRLTSDDLMLKTGAARETVQDALWELQNGGGVWETEDPETGERVYFNQP